MTLPASGNPLSLNQVNTELGLSGTSVITMNDTNVRTIFGSPSGAIDMNSGFSKGRSSVVTWPSNLAGGSTLSAGSIGSPTTQWGSTLDAGQSISFDFNVSDVFSPRVNNGGSYLYTYLTVSPYTFNPDGTINAPFNISYPYWGSNQAGAAVYLSGTNGSDTPNAIAWCFYKTCVGNRVATSGDIGIRLSTSVNGNNDGIAYYTSFPTSSRITLTNTSSTNYYIGTYAGANGHYTPIYFGFFPPSNTFTTYQANIDVTNITAFGLKFASKLTINGTDVSYTAPNGATQTQVIAGFKSAINSAGISNVIAYDYTNGLKIVGATSVTSTPLVSSGSVNYAATVNPYGVY